MSVAKYLKQRPHHTAFNLQDMGAIHDQFGGRADLPHRHDYFTVLLVENAAGSHLIDYKSYEFREREVHFISPGQVHQVVNTARPSGKVLTFTRGFLAENNIPERFISNISLFREFGECPPLQPDGLTFDKLRLLVQEMETVLQQEIHYRNRALGSLLQLFLIYCSNTCSLNQSQLDEDNRSVCMLRDFKALVEQHFQEWHGVATYAAEMAVSPKHLSHTVKLLTGKAAKSIIDDRVALEARRLLLHTDLSIKEVAYQVGFEEPLHFSGFFKKQTGSSPSDFRRK
jgi:AraC-like DNA-binding protein